MEDEIPLTEGRRRKESCFSFILHPSNIHDLRRRRFCFTVSGLSATLVIVLIISLVLFFIGTDVIPDSEPELPTDPYERALALLELNPLIDGHNDLPFEIRAKFNSSVSKTNLNNGVPNLQTDIPRLRAGRVGGQFWSVFVPCETQYKDAVRMTLEQIDIVYRLVHFFPQTFQLAYSSYDIGTISYFNIISIESAFAAGKIASLIGMEGGHHIDSSLSALRMFYQLGARYMTLTHSCSNPWAQSAHGPIVIPDGLTSFGKEVVLEMNRLGMMVDISHVANETMHAVLNISRAPVIFSHSCVYTICPNPRNVPDSVLDRLPANGGLVMINFFNNFLNCNNQTQGNTTLMKVVEHIDYVKKRIGVDYVGLGSDFDGVGGATPIGLKDVSMYPNLVSELIKRGYTDSDVVKIIGGNLLRVFSKVESTSYLIQDEQIPDENLINFNFTTVSDVCRSAF